MAFLTYRQSSTSKTEAQLQNKNIELGRPLNITEVDANFAAVSADLTKMMNECGLSLANGEGLALNEIYDVDSADVIKNTGFYSASSSTYGLPASATAGCGIVHIENTLQTDSTKPGALQVSHDSESLWYRIRVGTSTWEAWKQVISYGDLVDAINVSTTNTDGKLSAKVSKAGDDVTGDIIFKEDSRIKFINKQATKNPAIDSEQNTLGIDFFDKRGMELGANRLAEIGNRYVANDDELFNEVTIGVNNPSVLGQEQRTGLTIGWQRAIDKDGYIGVNEYATAPYPRLDTALYPDQIATVKWADDYLQGKINMTFDPSNYLSTITGGYVAESVTIAKDFTVHGSTEVDGDVVTSYVITDQGMLSGGEILINYPDMAYDVNPSEQYLSGFIFGVDDPRNAQEDESAFTTMGIYQHGALLNTIGTDGSNDLSLVVKQWNESNTDSTRYQLGITTDNNGGVRTHAPTPSLSDVSTQIATTEWVKNNLLVLDFGTM